MQTNPEKFLYIYLQDMTGNPKLCFELHKGPLPETRKSYAKTSFESLEKEAALENVKAIQNVGFFVLVGVLLEMDLRRGRFWAMIVYPHTENSDRAIHIDEDLYHEREGGDFYTFIPLKPFDTDPEKLNTDENVHNHHLQMRIGRIVANALLDEAHL